MPRNYIIASIVIHVGVAMALLTSGSRFTASEVLNEDEAVVVLLPPIDSVVTEEDPASSIPMASASIPTPPEPPATFEPIDYAGAAKSEAGESREPSKTEPSTDEPSVEVAAASLARLEQALRENLQRATTLISKGARVPGFRIASLDLELIGLLAGLGMGTVAAEYQDRAPAYVVVELGRSGRPEHLTTISGERLGDVFSSRAILMPARVAGPIEGRLTAAFGQHPDQLYLLIAHRLDRLILAAQLQTCSRLGVAVEDVAWTDGRFDVAAGNIAGFRISLVGLHDGSQLHAPAGSNPTDSSVGAGSQTRPAEPGKGVP